MQGFRTVISAPQEPHALFATQHTMLMLESAIAAAPTALIVWVLLHLARVALMDISRIQGISVNHARLDANCVLEWQHVPFASKDSIAQEPFAFHAYRIVLLVRME